MRKRILIFILGLSTFIVLSQKNSNKGDREYYQLKIYSFDTEGQIQLTDQYLKDAYLPALKRLNIGPVGVFKPRPIDSVTPKKTYVLIPFKSWDQFEHLDDALAVDKAYLQNGKSYITATYDAPPYARIESILLKAFPEMPVINASTLAGPRAERVYELRSYESATVAIHQNKVAMFNLGGEVALFDKLGFNAVFYAQVISGSRMPNLMYLTTFADQESRDAHWKSFNDAPEWMKLKGMPEYQNNVSKNEQLFLYPTDYSDY